MEWANEIWEQLSRERNFSSLRVFLFDSSNTKMCYQRFCFWSIITFMFFVYWIGENFSFAGCLIKSELEVSCQRVVLWIKQIGNFVAFLGLLKIEAFFFFFFFRHCFGVSSFKLLKICVFVLIITVAELLYNIGMFRSKLIDSYLIQEVIVKIKKNLVSYYSWI